MNILHKRSFVIETRLPKNFSFSNKKVIDDNLGEVIVPDKEPEYEYHWFGGVFANPDAAKKGILVPMNLWSPYVEDAARYSSEDEAKAVWQLILGSDSGSYVVMDELSHLREGRLIKIPITTEEYQAMQTPKGMDGRKPKI